MRAVLLGPNGQLGSDIVRAAAAKDGKVAVKPLDRERLDVAQLDRIGQVLRPLEFDVVINCTSYHKTDEVEKNAAQAFAVNAHAVARLAEVCAEKRARLVHISTDYVFDGAKGKPYRESDAPGPLNIYGASKLMGERLAARACPSALILRVASLFGFAGSSGKGGNFVETMLKVGKEKGQLRVVNDITMSPTGTADVARVLLELLAREAEPGIYHVVNTGNATWYEFAVEIIRRARVKATVTPVTSTEFPTAAVRPAYSALSNGKVVKAVGAVPTWQDGLDRYLRAKGHI